MGSIFNYDYMRKELNVSEIKNIKGGGPVAVYKGGYYALNAYYDENNRCITELYYYKDGKADRVNLAGESKTIILPLGSGRVNIVGESLYYPAKVGAETKLYRLDFATNTSTEVCSLSKGDVGWSLDDEGWFGGVISLGEKIFMVLHVEDSIMGGDTIYRLVNNRLIHVGGAKSLSSIIDKAGLYHLDILTGHEEKLSNVIVDDILINETGAYFINKSYDPGIFKIIDNKATKIADGFLREYVNTQGGVLYNKRCADKVYLAIKK